MLLKKILLSMTFVVVLPSFAQSNNTCESGALNLLINGGFEQTSNVNYDSAEQLVDELGRSWKGINFVDKHPDTDFPGWFTTGGIALQQGGFSEGGTLELGLDGFLGFESPEGQVFVEMDGNHHNQIFKVEPNSLLDWQISHRGRDGIDAVSIAITSLEPMRPKGSGPRKVLEEVLVESDNSRWFVHRGQYQVPEDVSELQIIISPVTASNGDMDSSHLLDDVRVCYSQEQINEQVIDDSQEPIKLLMVEGFSNHDWQLRADLVRTILERDGSFDITLTVTPELEDDPEWQTWRPNFSEYDVVMSGYSNLLGGAPWPEEVQQAFSDYVYSGGGYYVYHEANNSFVNWPEYNEIIGMGWRKADFGSALVINEDESIEVIPAGTGLPTGHGPRDNVLITRMNEHPIHQGLPNAWMAADLEVYRYTRGPAENVTVLSYATDQKTGLQFPTEWVVAYGEGQSYVSTYGHVGRKHFELEGARCVAFQTIMVRALKWLAGREVDNAVPSDFPSTQVPSLRPYARDFNSF